MVDGDRIEAERSCVENVDCTLGLVPAYLPSEWSLVLLLPVENQER